MNLVDDQVADALPVSVPARLAEHQREALGRRDQEVGRGIAELAPVVRRGVAGADADGDRAAVEAQRLANGVEGFGQVPLDVVAEAP